MLLRCEVRGPGAARGSSLPVEYRNGGSAAGASRV